MTYIILLIGPFLFFQMLHQFWGQTWSQLNLTLTSLLFLGLLLLLERKKTYSPEWNKNKGDLKTDVLYSYLVFPIAFFIAELLMKNVKGFFAWPSQWPAFIQIIIGLLIGEFFYYWYHRLGHSVPWLWRFHAFHHEPLRVYSVNSARFHFVDGFLGALAYLLPLQVLNCPSAIYTQIMLIGMITGYLEHANIEMNAGSLNYFFNSAEMHRWHHALPHETKAVNFGKALAIYDWIFGTALLRYDRVPEVGS